MKTLLCVGILSCGLALLATRLPERPSLDEFAARYKKAASEHEKLLLCIDAIDQRMFSRDGPVGNVDKIFGTDLQKKIPGRGQPPERGVVHFGEPMAPVPSDAYQHAYRGWYLAVEFDWNGSIQDYYLSDLHK